MANPVFSNSPVFRDPAKQRPGRDASVMSAGTYGAPAADAATLETMYGAPAATTRDTGRMTYDDVIMKTGGLLAVLVVAATASWMLVDTMPFLWIGGALVGLVLGLVNAFKREPSPVLISLYAVAQGFFLGGISAFYDARWDGIVLQAVLATVSVFAASLFLFSSGKVRVTPKFTRILMVGLVGYLVFSLVNLVLSVTGVVELRAGPLGFVVGLVAVVLGAMSLIMDFDSIQRGVRQGVPARYAWAGAFGLLVTLIWLYLELLRLIAILRGDD
ncbi:Bax inhibitor-1/YccA family membrane protein [Cellulomonas endophytica]|uniref:Bax inhibitor-1/YccA family protein n=1 Tax=Cellulomonas endophytica TaxID=2494735 RepID=UPI001012C4B9|nr:Bax inhibitor-1/YccA family protein [Cellulomonas endophytica]